jgi:hypothetical protein
MNCVPSLFDGFAQKVKIPRDKPVASSTRVVSEAPLHRRVRVIILLRGVAATPITRELVLQRFHKCVSAQTQIASPV